MVASRPPHLTCNELAAPGSFILLGGGGGSVDEFYLAPSWPI